MENSSDEVI